MTLSAQPNPGARFVEWQGPCAPSGSSAAELTMGTLDQECTAVFEGGLIVGQAGVVDLVSVDPVGGDLNWVAGRTDARSTVDLSTDGFTAAFVGKIPTLQTPLSYYSRDLEGAVTRTLSPTSTSISGQNLSVSSDGRLLAFTSDDPTLNGTFNLLPPPSGNYRVFVEDTKTGAVQLVSGNDPASGIELVDQVGSHVTISDNGRWVAFVGRLVRRSGSQVVNELIFRVLIRDTCLGVPGCTPSTTVASATADGIWPIDSNSYSHLNVEPSLSADGRFLTYRSNSVFLATGGTTGGIGTFHVFLRDRDADGNGRFDESGGVTQQAISLLATPSGVPLSAPFPTRPVISADGRFVVYREAAPGTARNCSLLRPT